jgi:hypothetical protein
MDDHRNAGKEAGAAGDPSSAAKQNLMDLIQASYEEGVRLRTRMLALIETSSLSNDEIEHRAASMTELVGRIRRSQARKLRMRAIQLSFAGLAIGALDYAIGATRLPLDARCLP